jgi:GNAT superfamily N-acetyltransferase
LDALIARQRDFFAARGEPVEWKTRRDDQPAEVTERLLAAGFVAQETETVMLALAADIAAVDQPEPPGVTFRRTAETVDLQRIGRMESEVWNDEADDWGGRLADQLRADGHTFAVFVAESGPELVAAAWLALERGTEFAGLWGGATRPAWRGRGVYRALVAQRARLALQWGARFLQVDASDDSRPILQRLGFVAVTTTTPYLWRPQEPSSGVR